MKPLIPYIVGGVLLLGFTWLLNHEHNRANAAERRAEAADLILKGQTVELEQTRAQLEGNIQEMVKKDVELQAALDQARKAAPDARPVSVSKLDTGPLPVKKKAAAAVPPPPPSGSAVCEDCALTYADQLDVQVSVLELQTKLQNTVVVGTAEVYKVQPRTLLANGRFQASLSSSHKLEVPAEPGWGAMALGACGSSGCGAGGLVLFPPTRVLGLRLEAAAGALAVPAGLQGVVGAGMRW